MLSCFAVTEAASSFQIMAPTHGSKIIQPPDSGTPDAFAERQRLSLLPTTDTPLGLLCLLANLNNSSAATLTR